jgi:hypothetical protein
VDEAPNPVKEALTREDADSLRAQLEEAGATVELQVSNPAGQHADRAERCYENNVLHSGRRSASSGATYFPSLPRVP